MVSAMMAVMLAQAAPSDQTMELRCAAALRWYHQLLLRQGNRDLVELSQTYGTMFFFLGRLNARDPSADWLGEASRLSERFAENRPSFEMASQCVSLQSSLLHGGRR